MKLLLTFSQLAPAFQDLLDLLRGLDADIAPDAAAAFEVNVVARMSAEGYETDYFVNDEFNLAKGKLKIMRDNAVPYTKTLDDSKVKILPP